MGNNKGWAIPNRAENLAPYFQQYFNITDFFKWDLPTNFNDYDLIHMHHPVLNDKISSIRKIWGFEISGERVLSKVIKFKLFELAHFVVAKNKKLYQMAINKSKGIVYYIPNGVDTNLFKPPIYRVGWVGNDTSSNFYTMHKGTVLVAQACNELNKELKGLVEVEFVKDPSKYPKIFPQEEIAKFYHGLDMFVLPSISEGSSNVILEALSTGIPVITTRVGNWDEFDRVVTLTERNVNAIKEDIRRVLQPQINRRKLILDKFTWEKQAQSYLALYKDLGVI